MNKSILLFILIFQGLLSQTLEDPNTWKIWENGWKQFVIYNDSLCNFSYREIPLLSPDSPYKITDDSLFIIYKIDSIDIRNYWIDPERNDLWSINPPIYKLKFNSFDLDTLILSGLRIHPITDKIIESIKLSLYKINSFSNPNLKFDSLYYYYDSTKGEEHNNLGKKNVDFLLTGDSKLSLVLTEKHKERIIAEVMDEQEFKKLINILQRIDFERLDMPWKCYEGSHIGKCMSLKIVLGNKEYKYMGNFYPPAFSDLIDYLEKYFESKDK